MGKEIVKISQKYVSEKNNRNLTLPPQVDGKLHGYLDFVIEKLTWTTTKKFCEVEIKVNWWGQSEVDIAAIKFDSSASSENTKSIRYQVYTNNRLLQSYLRHCESITMQIYSIKNKTLIGRSRIPIQGLRDSVKNLKVSSSILSPNMFKIGEINVSIRISDKTIAAIKEKYIIQKENIKGVTFKEQSFIKESASNKENITIIGVKKQILPRDAAKSTNSIGIHAYQKPITHTSRVTNHANSTNVLLEPSSLKNIEKELNNFNDCSNHGNSIKIAIIGLELNASGLELVKGFIAHLNDKKCIIKCAVSSKYFKAKSYEDSNFFSYAFDSPSQKIEFQRNKGQFYFSIHPDGLSRNTCLNIGFCLKSIEEEKAPLIMGFSSINLKEIFKLSHSKRCHVMTKGDVNVGIADIEIGILSSDKIKRIDSIFKSTNPLRLVNQQIQTTCHPSKSSKDSKNSSDHRMYETKIVLTNDGNSSSANSHNPNDTDDHHRDTEMVDVEPKEDKIESKIYHVLIFIESLRSVKEQDSGREYFFTYEGFWNQCEETSEVSKNYNFNYLKQSPIICNNEFLERVKNNHLELKLWEKTNDNTEKLTGLTRLSLHQFYVAFKDAIMIEHLSTNQLPVISTDNWCNFFSPLFSELFCQAKILLAIGSQQQIDYLIISRNLFQLQTTKNKDCYQSLQSPQFTETNAQLKNRLSAFIDSLSKKLPVANEVEQTKDQQKSGSPSLCSENIHQPKLRKTSDLLDSLQEALSIKPFTLAVDTQIETVCTTRDNIKLLIGIETATNLPKVTIKKVRNKRKSNEISEYEPFAYVTFEALINDYNSRVVKSHEGNVYCTKVVKGSNPCWNESFEVAISVDILRNPQKKFVVKVWRKAKFDQQQQHFLPKPFEDAVLGFSAIDLSALVTGIPILSGYYNIVDFSGKINGQIKLSFKPLQDVVSGNSSPLVTLSRPDPCNDPCNGLVLSRTLKRKFSELDEITQRLKARLFNVTGDENFDPDEEFEKDLNTVISDEEDNIESKEDFAWLKKDTACYQAQVNKVLKMNQPSTSSNELTSRKISGCSKSSPNKTPPLAIDYLLKKYDLDELINPNIFKNIFNPNSNSDSTPSLNLNHNAAELDYGSDDAESATTASSIISNEQVQTIQQALQRTSLEESTSEQKKIGTERKDPDGETHVSE